MSLFLLGKVEYQHRQVRYPPEGILSPSLVPLAACSNRRESWTRYASSASAHVCRESVGEPQNFLFEGAMKARLLLLLAPANRKAGWLTKKLLIQFMHADMAVGIPH
jgi:hypothetical protein